MDLDELLRRCTVLERRAAGVYRMFAARTRHLPDVCALWTALAREEEVHAHTVERAASWLDPGQGFHTSLDGWQEALDEIEARLADAERPENGSDVRRQLVAALGLERTELDTLFNRLLALVPAAEQPHDAAEHTAPLLTAAARYATDPGIALEAALLHARRRLQAAS